MLQSIRQAGSSIVVKVFFALLVISFALVGVGSGFRDLLVGGGQSTDAAKVGNTKITLGELDQSFRRQLANLQRQNPNFTPDTAIRQQVARTTLDQLVADALVADAAANFGLLVNDETVRQEILKLPAFAGENKQFDRIRFQFLLQNQGMSEADFTALIRHDVARRLLVEPIAAGAFAPKALVEAIYRYRNEQRVAETVLIPNSAMAGIPAPTDADLSAYYAKHAADFTLPEYRTFSVLTLTPELFMNEIKPTEDDLRAAYEAHKADLVEIEKRQIEQVVVSDKAVADSIAKAVQDGKTLADAAKAATAGKVQPVMLDFTERDQIPEALRDPVFSASKGALVGPVQSPLGWHVLRIDDIHPGHTVSFEEAKPKLEADVKREGAADRLAEQIDKLGDKLLGGAPMDQVGAGIGATPVKLGPFDSQGGTAPNAADVKRPPESVVLRAAFRLKSGETSPFQEGTNGSYFAVRVDNVVPPQLRPLPDVRSDVATGWQAEQRRAAAAKRAEELAQKAKSGMPMSQIASEAHAKLETTAPASRNSSAQPGINAATPSLVAALFGLTKIGDVTTVATPDGTIVARLSEIRAADPTTAATALSSLKQQLDGAQQEDQLAEYQAALRQRYTVKMNPTAVETIAGQ